MTTNQPQTPEQQPSIADDTLNDAQTDRKVPAGPPSEGSSAKSEGGVAASAVSIDESKYEIRGTLGKGGMGEVLFAKDVVLDRPVAIKRIRIDATVDDADHQRFQREARTAARISHPNVVQVFDLNRDRDGNPFIVMEYIDGESLKDRLARGPLSLNDSLDMIIAVCDGLAAAHRCAIIHRDIKPANIMLTKASIPKITDFGLARFESSSADGHSITDDAVRLLTRVYSSPEQELLPARDLDARTDIYSLGQTFYHMVTGEMPHPADMDLVPEAVREPLKRALKRRREDRFQTVDAFREALLSAREAIQAGRGRSLPPQPVPPSFSPADGAACTACGTVNPLQRKFCCNCGGNLTEPCLNEKCGQVISSGEKFCPHCGADILRIASQLTSQFDNWCGELTTSLGKHDFRQAAKLAKQLEQVQHPRFRSYREKGGALSRQAEQEKTAAETLVREASDKATRLLASDAVDEALVQVARIPSGMMDFKLTMFLDTPHKLKQRIESRKRDLQRIHNEKVRQERAFIVGVLNEAEQLRQRSEFDNALKILRDVRVSAAVELSDQPARIAEAIEALGREKASAELSRDRNMATVRELLERRLYSDARKVLDEIPRSLCDAAVLSLKDEVQRNEQRLLTAVASIRSQQTSIERLRVARDYTAALKLLREFVSTYDRELVKEPQISLMIHELVGLQNSLETEQRDYSEKCRLSLASIAKDIAECHWTVAAQALADVATAYRNDDWKKLQQNLVAAALEHARRLSQQSEFLASSELMTRIHEIASAETTPPKDEILRIAGVQKNLHEEVARLLARWKSTNAETLAEMPYNQVTVDGLNRLCELLPKHPDRKRWQHLTAVLRRKESNRLVKQAIARANEDLSEESEAAMGYFAEAKEADPANPHAYRECSKYSHDPKRAFQNAVEAIRLDPKDSRNWLLRGQIYLPRSPEKAAKDFSKAVETAADLAQRLRAHSFRAEARAKLGDYFSAIEDIEYCLSNSTDVLMLEQRARIHAMFRKYDEAIADNLQAEQIHRKAGAYAEADYLHELVKRLKQLKRKNEKN